MITGINELKTSTLLFLEVTNIKSRTCYYFDDINEVEDINDDRILLDKKSYKISCENILVYHIFYKRSLDGRVLCIRFNKVNGLIKTHDGIRYVELSDSYNEVYYGINFSIYNAFFDRINLIQDWPPGLLTYRGEEKGPPSLKSFTYPTVMKLGTVIPRLKKTQKVYESHDAPFELC